MPNNQSTKKRMRQAESRNERNRRQRSTLRTALKKVRTAETAAEATAAMTQAEQLIDRAARKKLVHPNLAARTKSRLRKAIAAKS